MSLFNTLTLDEIYIPLSPDNITSRDTFKAKKIVDEHLTEGQSAINDLKQINIHIIQYEAALNKIKNDIDGYINRSKKDREKFVTGQINIAKDQEALLIKLMHKLSNDIADMR